MKYLLLIFLVACSQNSKNEYWENINKCSTFCKENGGRFLSFESDNDKEIHCSCAKIESKK